MCFLSNTFFSEPLYYKDLKIKYEKRDIICGIYNSRFLQNGKFIYSFTQWLDSKDVGTEDQLK